jgi:hypothetical protein
MAQIRSFVRRLGWMVAIWAMSVLTLGAVAGIIRLVLDP